MSAERRRRGGAGWLAAGLAGGAFALSLGAPAGRCDAEGREVEGMLVGAVRAAEDAAPRPAPVEERLQLIRERIQAALVYPPLARQHALEGVAELRFAIGADGRPERLAVAASSGHAILDRAALSAVQGAAPLPWVYGLLEVPVRFELSTRR